MLRKVCLAAVVALTLASDLPAQAAPVLPTVVAQAQVQGQEEERKNTPAERRRLKGLVKLGIAGLIGIGAVGGWAFKKMRGQA